MKRFLLFVMMCVCVSIGAWAQNYANKFGIENGSSYEKVGNTIYVNVATPGDWATYVDQQGWQLQGTVSGFSTIKFIGTPSQADIDKSGQYPLQGQPSTRLDLCDVSSSVSACGTVGSCILPRGTTAPGALDNSQGINYIIAPMNNINGKSAVTVSRKQGNTDWQSDDYVTNADYIFLKGNFTEDDKSSLESTFGVGKVLMDGDLDPRIPIEDLTINNVSAKTVSEQIYDHIGTPKYIGALTITDCEMDNLAVLNGMTVQSLNLSGVTNTDITGLKLPNISDETENILLPNNIILSTTGALTTSSSTTLTNLDAAIKALKEIDRTASSVDFPNGSTFSSNTLTVSAGEKNNIEQIGTIIKDGGLTINAISVDGTQMYNNGILTLSDATIASALCELVNDNELNVTKITFPNGSVWENGNLTVNDADNTAEGLTAIKNLLEKAGKKLGDITFPSGTTYSGGMVNVSRSDKDEHIVAGTDTRLKVIHDNLNALGLTIDNVRFEDGTRWNSDNTVTHKGHQVEKKIEDALAAANFTYTSATPSQFPDLEYDVTDGVVTIKSYREGALNEVLSAPEHGHGQENYPFAQQMRNDIRSLDNYTLVLEGAYNGNDLSKFTNDVNKNASTVNMSNTKFSNVADAVFTYWDGSKLTTAYMSNDAKLTTITEDCFRNMNNIQNLYIGESVTEIPNMRFQSRSNLQYVKISNSVRTIGESAFLNCSNLRTVEYGKAPSLSIIKESAFEGTGLTGPLVIPNSVTRIEKKAFKRCLGITQLTINEGSNLEYIGEEAFRMDGDFALKDVYVYAEKNIECHTNAWDFYMTDGQTVMSTVKTRLHYPPSRYYWYVGDWKSSVKGGRIEGHEDLLALRNSVDSGTAYDEHGNPVIVTPKAQIGWQKFISSGIPVTFDMDWRTYSDIVDLKVPEYDNNVADVYIVCGYEDGKAVLKQMKQNDIIPAGTGLVIHHYVTNQQNGGVLFFPHLTPQEASAAVAENPDALKPYLFVSDGDKRGSAGESEWDKDEYAFAKGMNYVGIETRDYVCDGKSYHNYLEAIHCMGVKRAIYNAENGNYIDYNTLEMKAYSGQKVTYRNFFFGNGEKLQASMTAGSIGKGKDWNADTDGKMGWGFFRCMTDMYAINSKAFLHYPADVFTQSHSASPGTITEGVTASAKTFDNMILLDEDYSSPSSIATGITTVNNETTIKKEGYYTIQGVKVSTPIKNGLYIHNGKKYVVK